MPTWLDAGPGMNWHRATRSAYSSSLSHLRLSTNSSRKYPKCAVGPPKDVRPRRVNMRSTSNTSAMVAEAATRRAAPTPFAGREL